MGYGIRENPVIPWNFENPVPAQTDPVESLSRPVQTREIEISQSPPNQSRSFLIPRDLSRDFVISGNLSRDF